MELVGLCKSAVRWLAESNKAGIYPYAGVETTVDGKHLIHYNFKNSSRKKCLDR